MIYYLEELKKAILEGDPELAEELAKSPEFQKLSPEEQQAAIEKIKQQIATLTQAQ